MLHTVYAVYTDRCDRKKKKENPFSARFFYLTNENINSEGANFKYVQN